jgi:hypothetical protein
MYAANNDLAAYLSGITPTTVSAQHRSFLNDDQLNHLSDSLQALSDITLTGIDIRYPSNAPAGSWFLREGSSAGKIALDRMIYVASMRLRDLAADVVSFGQLDAVQTENVGHAAATILFLHSLMAQYVDGATANDSLGRSLKSSAFGLKEASDQQRNGIFKLMVEWVAQGQPNGEVRLYESCVNSPVNALGQELTRYQNLLSYLNSLDDLQKSRIDASKRGAQVTVVEAKQLCDYNIRALKAAIAAGISIEDPVKERTTDPMEGRASVEGNDDDARRAASDQKMTDDLAAEFGGVFRNWDESQTIPAMH